MKNKKVMAIALSISIFASSFSGVYVGFAKNNTNTNNDENYLSNNESNNTVLAPQPEEISFETDLTSESKTKELKLTGNSDSIVLYEGTKRVINSNNPDESDIFNIEAEEVQDLLEEGYSVQEILKADEIGNEIIEEPKDILERAKASGKSLDDVKEEVVKEKKEKSFNELKEKYKNEYKELSDQKFSQDEISDLLTYLSTNDLQLTDDLVSDYKKNKEKAFKKIDENKVTKETQKKYKLSDKEAEKLTEETIKSLEKIAKKINKPIDEVIETYIECN